MGEYIRRAISSGALTTTVMLAAGLLVLSADVARAAGWSVVSPLGAARRYHSATLLQNGKVLLAGGQGLLGQKLADAELFDRPRRWARMANARA